MRSGLEAAKIQLELQSQLTVQQLRRLERSMQEYGAGGDDHHRTRTLNEKLVRLQQAKHRVRIGTYGLCVTCGEPIHPERLEALPDAIMCTECQTQAIKEHLRKVDRMHVA